MSDDALRAVAVGLIALGIDERPAADEQRQVKQRLRLHRGALGSIKTYFVKKIGFHYKNWFFSTLLGMRFVVGRSSFAVLVAGCVTTMLRYLITQWIYEHWH